MASLAGLEGLLERIFERTTARVLRPRVTAVHLARGVERAMDHARRSAAGRSAVPSAYRVRLHPRDLATAAGASGGAEALAGQLADGALAHARHQGYVLRDRPVISIVADPSLPAGRPAIDPVAEATPHPIAPSPGTSDPTMADRTIAWRQPEPAAPRARLRVVAGDGRTRSVLLDGQPFTIGRARDNDLVLPDNGVSRHHGRVAGRAGLLVYADLGSTNGSRVNGVVVDEIVLGPGDQIGLGGTVLVVEPVEPVEA